MTSAGVSHSGYLMADGMAGMVGSNNHGQCALPKLPYGVEIVQVSCGYGHTVFLCSNGEARAVGNNSDGQCIIPKLEDGIEFMQVSAGNSHTVFLSSDGRATGVGDNNDGQCNIPPLSEYVQVAAGGLQTALLLRDGRALVIGNSMSEDEPEMCRTQFDPWAVPALADKSIRYVAVAAGESRSALLRSDGSVVVVCRDGRKNYEIPRPRSEDGAFLDFVQVSVGSRHIVLLCSDGRAIAMGANPDGRCDIPELDDGASYLQVSAGRNHTVLLRSDGAVLAVGRNDDGQCNIPELRDQRTWLQKAAADPVGVIWPWWFGCKCA